MKREFSVRIQAEPEIPALLMTEKKYKLSIPEGENYQASFWIRSENDSQISGVVTANNHRILIANSNFSGKECKITFGLDTKGMTAGDEIEGNMIVISNLCEARIQVQARIVEKMISDKGTEVTSLKDFAQVCKEDYEEGFRMYRNPWFMHILEREDPECRPLYKGLSVTPVTYQHMEEFLVSAGLKSRISLSLDRESQDYHVLTGTERDSIYIYRNTWGYVHLDIDVTGDFIELSRKAVSTDEFIGKVFALHYVINYEKLAPWKKTATIRVRSLHQELVFMITASRGESVLKVRDIRAHKQQCQLTKLFLKYKLGQTEEATWFLQSRELIEDLCISYPTEARYVLYKAYMYMERGRNAEAMRMIWPIKEGTLRLRYQEEKATYLYIAKQISLLPDEEQNILPELETISKKLPYNVYIRYMINKEEEKKSRPDELRILRQLEFCYEAGCNSPFLYLYAWTLLRKNESNLRRLSPFYLAVLRFAMKNGVLTEKAVRRAAFLSDNFKRFSPNLYRLLVYGYQKYRTDDFLEAICRLVIKGQAGRKEYFRWYQLAIRRNLRITRIYEYYMETNPGKLEQPLPMPVLMYFAYNDTLSKKMKAFLYASIVKHKEKHPQVYLLYREKMQNFAEQALEKSVINEYYAILYKEFFSQPSTGRIAALMTAVLFRCRISTNDSRVRNVVIVYDALASEEVYPISNGLAYANIYDRRAAILFEDEYHRRFTDISWQMNRMMEEQEILKACSGYQIQSPGLFVYTCGESIAHIHIDEENSAAYMQMLDMDDFAEDYKQAVRKQLLAWYVESPVGKERTAFVYAMNVPLFVEADQALCVRLLIEEGRFVEAFAAMEEYGYEKVAVPLMLQMTREIIEQTEEAYDEELLAMSVYLVRNGKYDETVLAYMRSYYDGPVSDLCALRKMLLGFQMDTNALEGKILRQCVFAHTFPQQESHILKSYMRSQGNIQVITQYLNYICRQEMMERRSVGKEIHELMEVCYSKQWNLGVSSQISLLRYYADRNEKMDPQASGQKFSEEQTANISRLLENLMSKNIRFAFYKKLPEKQIGKYQISDKLFIEERLLPGSKAILCYQIVGRDGSKGEWIREPMQDVYHGIFVRELLLFYGEKVIYHLEVTRDGATEMTEEKILQAAPVTEGGRSRFQLLNSMLQLKDKNDAAGLARVAKEYMKQEAFVNSFLQLM